MAIKRGLFIKVGGVLKLLRGGVHYRPPSFMRTYRGGTRTTPKKQRFERLWRGEINEWKKSKLWP